LNRIRLIPHEESYEVCHPSGEPTFFYFDDNPGRRSINGRMSRPDALEKAKDFARAEQDKLDAADPNKS
jgi:hypothetical protein